MTKSDVERGGVYEAKVSGQCLLVRIGLESVFGGWDAVNLATGRAIRIRSARRLRRRVTDPRDTSARWSEAGRAAAGRAL